MDIYIPNKYSNTYFAIVNRSFSENRSRKDNRIYEQHHIIPKSCGGSDEPNNLVLLTPKEHYICHRLLPKMVKSRLHYEKMIYALWSLINGNGRSKRHSPSGKIYQQIKEEQGKIRSERMKGKNNPFYRMIWTDEKRKHVSDNNPTKREDVRFKISNSLKQNYKNGFKNHNSINGWDEETKQKLREANLGKTLTEETKLKMSESRKNKIWIKKKGQKSKHVHHSEVDIYISEGWSLGRTLGKHQKKRKPNNEEYKAKMSQSLSRKIWVSKPNENPKFINNEELENFINDGWVRGRKSL
jgi:hypothetical protein